MPFTIVAFLWRKPGITPSEFKSHYETVYIPLIVSLVGQSFPLSHSRFYLRREIQAESPSDTTNTNHPPTVFAGTTNDFDYDVYCMLTFEDKSAFETFIGRIRSPEVATKITEDEENFLDRQTMKVAAVDEPVVTTRPSE